MPKPPITRQGEVWTRAGELVVIEQIWWAPGKHRLHYKRGDGPAVIETSNNGTRMRWFAKNAPIMEVRQGNNRLPIKQTWSGKKDDQNNESRMITDDEFEAFGADIFSDDPFWETDA